MSYRNPKLIPTVPRVCRSHSRWRKASRSPGPAAQQVRVGDQPQDRSDTPLRNSADAACPCRRGDRVKEGFRTRVYPPKEPVMHLNLRLTRLMAFVAFAALSQTSFSSIGAAQTARVEVHP